MPPPIESAPIASGMAHAEQVRMRFALLCSADHAGGLPAPLADGEDKAAFEADRIDLACIIAAALAERSVGEGCLPDRLGLDTLPLRALNRRFFPGIELPDLDAPRTQPLADQKALAMLIRWRGGAVRPESGWFADILARRALCPRHLWEDLGLPNRAALTALIARHFPRLVALNAQNMRWKKFFYRQICSDTGFSLCLSPSCDECEERTECFPPGEAAPFPPRTH